MKNKQKDACYSNYQCAIYVQIITNQDMTNVLKTKRGDESHENCTGQRKINKETKQNII